MNDRSDLEGLLSAWRKEPAPSPRPPPLLDGPRIVAQALREVQRRRQRRRLLHRFAVLGAAAAVLLGVGISLWAGGKSPNTWAAARSSLPAGVALSEARGEVTLADASGKPLGIDTRELNEGHIVRTEQGSATLGFPSGAAARISRRSALQLTAARSTESLLLRRGRVDVEVPRLDPRRGFAVETPDARVVVHGTGFSVSVDAEATGIRTRVEVSHGVVSVQHAGGEVRLGAGQHWPPSEAEPAPGDAAESAAPEAAAPDGADERPAPRKPRRHRAPSARESRELAEQNEHFARAMTLKKQGRSGAALAELAHLLSSHPASPLIQEVHVERLRILRAAGRHADARREARRYLAEFPDGYASAEAQAELEEAP